MMSDCNASSGDHSAAGRRTFTDSEIEFDDFYLAYWSHCKGIDGRAVSPTEAVAQTNKLCDECGIPIQRRGKKRFLVGVCIKSASTSRRLGDMAREKRGKA
jgi:hypothetical protein